MQALLLLCLTALIPCVFSHAGIEVNPELGVPGFPDCRQTIPRDMWPTLTEDQLAMGLECFQQPKDFDTQIAVGCVGDSITAGAHSTGGNHTYPGQLQIMLGDGYKVTNLGACGSTMLKKGNSPYWQRAQFKTLNDNTWDIIVIMLGTNDAKDVASGGPPNWPHDCTGPDALNCAYAQDYASMIELIHTLGNPKIFVAIPPPLHQQGAYGMNATVINEVLPMLVPAIGAQAKLGTSPVDVFSGMDGKSLANPTTPTPCTLQNGQDFECAWWCDQQSCDQCHPDNDGYTRMATIMKAGMNL